MIQIHSRLFYSCFGIGPIINKKFEWMCKFEQFLQFKYLYVMFSSWTRSRYLSFPKYFWVVLYISVENFRTSVLLWMSTVLLSSSTSFHLKSIKKILKIHQLGQIICYNYQSIKKLKRTMIQKFILLPLNLLKN